MNGDNDFRANLPLGGQLKIYGHHNGGDVMIRVHSDRDMVSDMEDGEGYASLDLENIRKLRDFLDDHLDRSGVRSSSPIGTANADIEEGIVLSQKD